MNFCPECESLMPKIVTAAGAIVFQCRCQLTFEGGTDDTLMAEGGDEAGSTNMMWNTFISNSPFDPAANVVLKDCPQCRLNFLVMTRVGTAETTIYTCSCGYVATHEQYMRRFSAPPR